MTSRHALSAFDTVPVTSIFIPAQATCPLRMGTPCAPAPRETMQAASRGHNGGLTMSASMDQVWDNSVTQRLAAPMSHKPDAEIPARLPCKSGCVSHGYSLVDPGHLADELPRRCPGPSEPEIDCALKCRPGGAHKHPIFCREGIQGAAPAVGCGESKLRFSRTTRTLSSRRIFLSGSEMTQRQRSSRLHGQSPLPRSM